MEILRISGMAQPSLDVIKKIREINCPKATASEEVEGNKYNHTMRQKRIVFSPDRFTKY